MTPRLYPRFAQKNLEAALADTPAVLVQGPRQCGKTTLARMVGDPAGYAYRTFDDEVLRAAAQADPTGFVADLPDKVTLDEVQRVPTLFLALKAAIDRDRKPGRFILTGSANVLLLPQLSDSLAGRMAVLRLHPLSQAELRGQPSPFLDLLFEAGFQGRSMDRLGLELAEQVVAGGYPAALERTHAPRRASWYHDYLETLLQRDVRDLARIHALEALPRLLQMAATQTARLVNIAALAAAFQLSRPTIDAYVALLARLFLLEEVPPWHSNQLSRLLKSPKLHLGDTGIAAALLGVDAAALQQNRALLGQLLETFVYQELRRQASGRDDRLAFYHFRNKEGVEVDLVLERGALHLAGIEVKAAASVQEADFRGLRKLREAAGPRFRCGVVLYDGEHLVGFGDRLFAVPLRGLWENL